MSIEERRLLETMKAKPIKIALFLEFQNAIKNIIATHRAAESISQQEEPIKPPSIIFFKLISYSTDEYE